MITLVVNPRVDFVLHCRVDEREYAFDTRPIRSALGGAADGGEVLAWMNHLKEIQDLRRCPNMKTWLISKRSAKDAR